MFTKLFSGMALQRELAAWENRPETTPGKKRKYGNARKKGYTHRQAIGVAEGRLTIR